MSVYEAWSRVARRSASNFFALQGCAGVAWWLLMLCLPSSRAWFVPSWSVERLLTAVAFPDVAVYVCGSLVAAWTCRRSARWARAAAAGMVGAAGYAALLCLGLSLESGEGWLGAALMAMSALSYVTAVNVLRRRSRRREVGDEPVDRPLGDATEGIALRLAVRDLIATLPPRQRQAVLLRYVADLSIAEIASAMGCASGTVKSTLSQALRALRVELEEDDGR